MYRVLASTNAGMTASSLGLIVVETLQTTGHTINCLAKQHIRDTLTSKYNSALLVHDVAFMLNEKVIAENEFMRD